MLEDFTTRGPEKYEADLLWEHWNLSLLILLNIERPHFEVKETSKQHVNLEICIVFANGENERYLCQNQEDQKSFLNPEIQN